MFEVNLVPKIKFTALKAQHTRDFIVSICIIVCVVMITITAVLGVSFGVQKGVASSQKSDISRIEKEILQATDVNYVLTLQNQLTELAQISAEQPVFSRVMTIVSGLTPRFSGSTEPVIDWSDISYRAADQRVVIEASVKESVAPTEHFAALEAFQKTINAAYYDYGKYFDPNNEEIPVQYETIDSEQCLLVSGDLTETSPCGERGQTNPRYGQAYGVVVEPGTDPNECVTKPWQAICQEDVQATPPKVVHVYRDGQDYEGYHYEGECLEADGRTSRCKLVDQATIQTTEVSYGRSGNDVLVLRFIVSFNVAPEALLMHNQNVRLVDIPRQNATDSYMQINSSWFAERPEDCAPNDTVCQEANG